MTLEGPFQPKLFDDSFLLTLFLPVINPEASSKWSRPGDNKHPCILYPGRTLNPIEVKQESPSESWNPDELQGPKGTCRPGRGAKAGPWGGTTMDTGRFSIPGAMTPQEGGSSGAGLGLLLVMRAELQDPNGTSRPPWEGASTAGRQAGIPPGTAMPQGADPGGGPSARKAELSGSTLGPTAAGSSGGAGTGSILGSPWGREVLIILGHDFGCSFKVQPEV